ncbi:uncharacterized protein N0V89_010444 [Didymosphaeria variabile]|uniref:Inheritance of peroxisomes protein 1 n=1 Tax=Didymosphaeria variabile TaxID=1932322 RepID=A0A9W8XCT8_9PLEO|nr:uncharacterized protein N0V89_010444 [Didymosphaeria variabile]KAJ4346514.1 hypothetical protein N0V89_010444 [Didymosphaeria variabile]
MASQAPASRPAPPAVSNATVRRSFTLPARIATKSPSPAPASSTDGIETLFVCTSTKIVSFTASASSRRASPSRRHSANHDDAAPSIPWRSTTERTLAVGEQDGRVLLPLLTENAGPLRIYRVTSSNVSFLNSGNLLHTIFPRSQCWCVDGDSVFVLRVRQDAYYRIELPHETAEDKEKVQDFKKVLGQVLQYERTRCPFTRGFEVELPERPKSPPRRRPKKPAEKAKKWTFDKTWMPEDGSRPCTPILEGSDAGTASSFEEDDTSSICTDRSEPRPDTPATALEVTPPKPTLKPMPARRLSVAERTRTFEEKRSVTAPIAQMAHRLSFSSEAVPEEVALGHKVGKERDEPGPPVRSALERMESTDAQSIVSTVDSFYSIESSTQSSPTPPFLDAEGESANPWAGELSTAHGEDRGRSKHRRQASELTVRQSSTHTAEEAPVTPTDDHATSAPTIRLSPAPSTPPLVSDSDDDSLGLPSLDLATPPDAIRMKRLTGATQKRAFSPMPAPQNLFCPPTNGPRKQFTTALIRKTAEIVLGPPAHLVSLMLRIAAKISDGVFSFNTYRLRNITESIPGSWLSDDEEEDWADEDDFGIPLRNLDECASRRKGFVGDVD